MERERKWRRICEKFMESGLNMKAFAAEIGVNYYTFKAWQKRFTEVPSGEFMEVTLPAASGAYSLVLRNGRELKLSGSFSEARVRQLIGICESC